MIRQLTSWCEINSGTSNLAGLATMHDHLVEAFTPLADTVESLDLPPRQVVDERGEVVDQPLGQSLRITKHADAKDRVLLVIHYDTVFSPDVGFDRVTRVDEDKLQGPGVADAKGGLLVMLTALRAFEQGDFARCSGGEVGWQVILNPDEEIGSPGSDMLLREAAMAARVGMVYEPTLPDGTMVTGRKGSGNFTIVVHGKAAHAGRHFDEGRNAVAAAAEAAAALHQLNGSREGLTINIARIDGGGPNNIVTHLAMVHLNARVLNEDDQRFVECALNDVVRQMNDRDGLTATLHGSFSAPPKAITPAISAIQQMIEQCGHELAIPMNWASTGGVCDGNRLAAAGLPNIDTLGVIGGNLHSDREYVEIPSLTQRAKLSLLMLNRFTNGEWSA